MVQDELTDYLASQGVARTPEEVTYCTAYLSYYGYLHGKTVDDLTLNDLLKAIKQFQAAAGLEPDGKVGRQTSRAMLVPRCGVPDIHPLKIQMGDKYDETLEAKWRKRSLLYYFDSYVRTMTHDVQEDVEHMAWKSWMDVCGIKADITRDKSKADIIIGSSTGRRNQFDGPGGTLAWAYLPPGDDSQLLKYYDDSEDYVAKLGSGGGMEIAYLNVSAHETGHLLGLDHSKNRNALMAAFYQPGVTAPQPNDDVPRIQSLYGQPTKPPEPPTDPGPGPGTGGGGAPNTGVTIAIGGDIKSINIPGYRVQKLG